MKENTILYTALFGDYDKLKEHNYPKELSFCFTDRVNLISNSWTVVPSFKRFENIDERIRAARFFKANSHQTLPVHQYSIWVDASMQIECFMQDLITYLHHEEMATFKYPSIYGPRMCIYEEADACIRRGKDASDIIVNQMNRYTQNGFPKNFGLAETTIVVRKNSPAIKVFNELWWREICLGSRRDQLSFNYICWLQGVRYSLLPGYRLENPFSKFIHHKEQIYLGKAYTTSELY